LKTLVPFEKKTRPLNMDFTKGNGHNKKERIDGPVPRPSRTVREKKKNEKLLPRLEGRQRKKPGLYQRKKEARRKEKGPTTAIF